MLTISKENYLKTLYEQRQLGGNPVSTSVVAGELKISNAAISEMARKLSKEGLLDYTRYKGMQLTVKGEEIALKVIRRHRLWELFLIEVLGMSWGEVHEEAERLEHHTSDYLIDKIEAFLEFPEFDPHGDPIPDKNGKLPEGPKVFSLREGEEGLQYRIARVKDKNAELINYLTRIGLKLNLKIKIVEKLSFDNSINIKVDDKSFLLSEKVAESIFVAPWN